MTPRVLRRWEEGQPPGTAEELEALCQVMLRHGLLGWEVHEFRKSVFAACVSRQYPGLFLDQHLAHRADVDEAAWSWVPHMWCGPYPIPVVALLAGLKELEAEAEQRFRPSAPGTREARQEEAVAILRWAVAYHHGTMGRHEAAVAAFRQHLDWVRTRLSGGRFLSPRLQNLVEVSRVAMLQDLAKVTSSATPLLQIVDMYSQAVESGDAARSHSLLRAVLFGAYTLGSPEFGNVARPLILKNPELVDPARGDLPSTIAFAMMQICTSHLREADRIAESVEPLASAPDLARDQTMWLDLVATLAMRHGSNAEALTFFQQGYDLALQIGLGGSIKAFEAHLIELDQNPSAKTFVMSPASPQR